METADKPVVKIKIFQPDLMIHDDRQVLWGYVYGHPRFADGSFVRTSLIVRSEGNTIETLNTVYELIQDDNANDSDETDDSSES